MILAMERSDDIADFHGELDEFLVSAASATTWHVERVIKRSDFETTELVRGDPREGSSGRYIRKRLDVGVGAGCAYIALWNAQRKGSCPACVPRLVECSRNDDELTVVMEYVDGCTVRALVAAIGAGSKTAELVMPGLCDAVAMLHESFDPPLIHRDLKPSNVLMCGGAPVIIDFGSARQWREGADADTTHFITRRYAPPEQFGFGQTDVRSDVYALGKLLYFCLVGEDPPNVCDRQACERADLSPKACEVVCRACAFDPDARYRSASEVRRALLDALGPSGGGGRAPIGTGTPEHARGFAWDLPGDIASNSHPAAVAKEHEASARTSSAGRPSIAGRGPMSPLWWNSLRARWERFALRFERPLRWVSVLWNGWIYCGFSVFFIGSVNAIVSPNAHDALLPLWFRVIEYVGVGMVSMGSLCYLMLYKARIHARVPVLARLGRVKESAWAIALFAMGIAVPLAVGMISGLL